MKTFIIIALTLIFGFFFFFWIQGVSIISHTKKLNRERAEALGYTKEHEKIYGTPEEYLRYLEEKRWREEYLERMTHEARLEDSNYYNDQNINSYKSYDDIID